jgi:hypothetical protein
MNDPKLRILTILAGDKEMTEMDLVSRDKDRILKVHSIYVYLGELVRDGDVRRRVETEDMMQKRLGKRPLSFFSITPTGSQKLASI